MQRLWISAFAGMTYGHSFFTSIIERDIMAEKKSENWASWIESVILDFIERSPKNTLQNQAQDKAFENPLVGFSRGDDPIFETFKEHVGPFHWTPSEIFSLTFPETTFRPGELTVISYLLSQTKETKADNRKEKLYPSDRWVRARIFGEEVNVKLRQAVVSALQEKGIPAVAPQLSPLLGTKKIRPIRLFLNLVGAARSPCLRSGNLWGLRRPDHSPRQGHAYRLGGGRC